MQDPQPIKDFPNQNISLESWDDECVVKDIPKDEDNSGQVVHENRTAGRGRCQRCVLRITALAVISVSAVLMFVFLSGENSSKHSTGAAIPTSAPMLPSSYVPPSSSDDSPPSSSDDSPWMGGIFEFFPNYFEGYFQHPGSAQYKAYQWIQNDPALASYSFLRVAQRFALATLYFSTNGEAWSNWNNSLSYDVSECEWFSDSDRMSCVENRYSYLFLPGNNLQGTIPPELGLLTSLVEINLRGNFLNGTIPVQVQSLTNLQLLDIHDNALTGTLPTQLGQLTSLTAVRLSQNNFNGTIPSNIGALTNIQRFSASFNSLSGTLPLELDKLSHARYLFFSENNLTGKIPSTIGLMTDLWLLYLDNNHLTGAIPSSLGLLSDLRWLQLDTTDLEGSVPPEICGLVLESRLHELTVDCLKVQCDCSCDCGEDKV